jgi:hypothetical protein
MPYSVEEFDEARREAFREAVADAANVEPYRVEIISVTQLPCGWEAPARRLLEHNCPCELLFRVRVPRGEEEERAPTILAALTVENVNTRLAERGVEPALTFMEPAHIVAPVAPVAPRAPPPINGVHGPFSHPSCVRFLFCGYLCDP